mgnify:FL=1
MKTTIIHILIGLICFASQVKAQNFPFRYLPPITIAPTEEASCMFFDKEGMMWVGTNAGVKSYDGYHVKTYKTNAYQPGILPNNTIRSIAEDHQDNLWLGTRNGLVRMNKRTGKFKTFFLPDESQRIIYTLFVSKDGTLWIGTDGGLSYFNSKTETFYTYNSKNTWLIDVDGSKNRMTNYSVKAIIEDRNGDLLIGTWSAGLMRFRRGSNTFYRYPRLNALNSAYSLFLDKHNHLWVGTWGYGVVRLNNPQNVRQPEMHQYPYSTNHFDTFYKIVHDPVTKTLWACTREGVCYLEEDMPNAEWKGYTSIGNNPLNFNNDIATDGKGNIWLCTQNNGILQVNTQPSLFKLWNLDTSHTHLTINYVYSILTTDGENFWLGLNPYGIALHNRKTGKTLFNQEIPGFDNIPSRDLTTSISDIVQRSNGEIWIANNNYGVIVKPLGKPAYLINHETHPSIVHDNFVNTIFESTDKTMWIGQRNGLGIVYSNNQGISITMKEGKKDLSSCDIRHISQDKKGNIWLATDNEGIIRISGNARNPKSLKFKQYNPDRHNFAIDDATACLEDSRGRLWAISNSGGLFLYNKVEDLFEPKNHEYHLPGDRVLTIKEDEKGNLWLATDYALVNIIWGNDSEKPQDITYFTSEDGIGNVLFSPNTACKYGKELFFGSRTSFFSFTPSMKAKLKGNRSPKLVITDIIIDDQPFALLDSIDKEEISKEMPDYTRKITIPARVKKFSVEFSLLTYGNTEKNVYAYQLEGYDEDWLYCDKGLHRAAFQNLPSGTYHLRVKATDGYGKWQELPYAITIKVLPPWYASRIAFMLYILMLIGGIFVAARWYKERVKTKNSLQMGVILTNITHELLTPLTVISATIYKLKAMAPQYEEDYLVMDSNINRTTRLLRQILEVRKSQAGQLHLLASRGNLISFIEDACENIRPMAEHQQVRLKFNKPYSEGTAWFDADKMDKIIYNLLSNAIKYNKVGGKIDVSLSLSKEQAVITIADNGIGMSKKKMKRLYTRFFDGDYRKQNMPGTGIGLSLTHDLVKLHHGDIRCESLEGEGTIFTITLPIRKKAYAPDEIDVSNKRKAVDQKAIQQVSQEVNLEAPNSEEEDKPKLAPVRQSIFIRKNASKILVVEDNEELLALMLQVLSKNYHVFTAKNGKQAMNIIMKEKLDLVVSDVMMPIMDGIELTKQLKSDKSFWQLPIILLTAKNKEEDKTEAYATGADAYITKPFKFEELEVRINALLANRKKMIEKIETEVSLQASSEAEAQQEVHLSNPEQAFVTRAKETIMQHLSDADYDRETFAKDMAMGESTLYNKVKATTGQTVIAFITSIRMKEAQRIIQSNPNILISDVAIQVGFNTPKYFSKCFKKEFGVFPKEYAEKLKGNN